MGKYKRKTITTKISSLNNDTACFPPRQDAVTFITFTVKLLQRQAKDVGPHRPCCSMREAGKNAKRQKHLLATRGKACVDLLSGPASL